MSQIEPILQENKNRFVIFQSNIMIFGNGIRKWRLVLTAEEIDLSQDLNDWNKLNEEEKYFIKHILAFFALTES
jgi:ribonucleoside-diphosphate reductase beta chain